MSYTIVLISTTFLKSGLVHIPRIPFSVDFCIQNTVESCNENPETMKIALVFLYQV